MRRELLHGAEAGLALGLGLSEWSHGVLLLTDGVALL